MKAVTGKLINFLLAPSCILCERPLSYPQTVICVDCNNSLSYNPKPCRICAVALPSSLADICGNCLTKPPLWQAAYAPFIYKNEVSYLIKAYKFNQKLALGTILAGHFIQYYQAQTHLDEIDYIIPVPLHKKRLYERGFNQALDLAKIVSRQLNLPLLTHSCQRTRYTQSQSGLNTKERHKNLSNAFNVTQKDRIKGKNLMLFDDVYTTGSTFKALAKVVKQAGAKHIIVGAIARTLK